MNYLPLPAVPEKGLWYTLSPERAACADGTPYFAFVKEGSPEDLLIYFSGGGVAVNAYMEARPHLPGNPAGEHYYRPSCVPFCDEIPGAGVMSTDPANPFADFTVIALNYASGDFYVGAGEQTVPFPDGSERRVLHHGFVNYELVMREVKRRYPAPQRILICGCSAGGFGVSMLAADLADLYADCPNITVCADSPLLLYDWKEALSRWGAPEVLRERCASEDLALDHLSFLHREHPNVKLLYACSLRDNTLSAFQNALDGGIRTAEPNDGLRFTARLRASVAALRERIPGMGFLIFDIPLTRTSPMTRHQILNCPHVFTPLDGSTRAVDWLMAAVDGSVTSLGLEYLFEE